MSPRRGLTLTEPLVAVGVVALVVVAAVLATNATTHSQQGASQSPGHAPQSEQVYITDIPQDTGSERAKVTIEVFMQRKSPCDCDIETMRLGQSIGVLAPERIGVKFRDVSQPEDRTRLREVNHLKCLAGVAVDGKHTFAIPDRKPGAEGKTKPVDLMVQRSWMLADMGAILDQELKAAYGGQGLGLTPTEFERKMSAAMAALRPTPKTAGPGTPTAQ